jgi:hypothetical protein
MRMIGFELDAPTRKAVDKMLTSQGVRVEYVMEFDNIEPVKRAVEIDLGCDSAGEINQWGGYQSNLGGRSTGRRVFQAVGGHLQEA